MVLAGGCSLLQDSKVFENRSAGSVKLTSQCYDAPVKPQPRARWGNDISADLTWSRPQQALASGRLEHPGRSREVTAQEKRRTLRACNTMPGLPQALSDAALQDCHGTDVACCALTASVWPIQPDPGLTPPCMAMRACHMPSFHHEILAKLKTQIGMGQLACVSMYCPYHGCKPLYVSMFGQIYEISATA